MGAIHPWEGPQKRGAPCEIEQIKNRKGAGKRWPNLTWEHRKEGNGNEEDGEDLPNFSYNFNL